MKDFGNQMVKDHSKINDNLKEVAGKMNVKVPSEVSAKHHATIEKMSGMSGAGFDKAYVAAMVMDHEKDIAEFEKADKRGEESRPQEVHRGCPSNDERPSRQN